jgi:hypothetical protein
METNNMTSTIAPLKFAAAVQLLQEEGWSFLIIPGIVDLSKFDLIAFTDDTKGHKRLATIFQTDKHQDHKRLQLSNDTRPETVVLTAQVKDLILRAFPRCTVLEQGCSTLLSLSGCIKQRPHTDFDPGAKGSALSLACLIALEEGTQFHFYLGGDKNERLVSLHPGDLLVFRGDCPHSGAAYEKENIRIHMYVDLQRRGVCSRKDNQTFLLQEAITATQTTDNISRYQSKQKIKRSVHCRPSN